MNCWEGMKSYEGKEARFLFFSFLGWWVLANQLVWVSRGYMQFLVPPPPVMEIDVKGPTLVIHREVRLLSVGDMQIDPRAGSGDRLCNNCLRCQFTGIMLGGIFSTINQCGVQRLSSCE